MTACMTNYTLSIHNVQYCLPSKLDSTLQRTSEATAVKMTAKSSVLRWLITVLMGQFNHSISADARIMVSKNCPIVGEHVGVNFVAQ